MLVWCTTLVFDFSHSIAFLFWYVQKSDSRMLPVFSTLEVPILLPWTEEQQTTDNYDTKRESSILVTLLFPVLFLATEAHLRNCGRMKS